MIIWIFKIFFLSSVVVTVPNAESIWTMYLFFKDAARGFLMQSAYCWWKCRFALFQIGFRYKLVMLVLFVLVFDLCRKISGMRRNKSIWHGLLQFAAEEFLFRSGEVASEMFFVTSGAVDEIIESDVSLGVYMRVECSPGIVFYASLGVLKGPQVKVLQRANSICIPEKQVVILFSS